MFWGRVLWHNPPRIRGRNSEVECQLPKLDVAGSNPVARSGWDDSPHSGRPLLLLPPMGSQESRAVPCMLAGYGQGMGEATVQLVWFNRPARLRRAVLALAFVWAAALVALLIPVAHFLLVPGLLMLGVYLFVSRYRTSQTVTAARGVCPDCGAEQDLDISGQWCPPHRVTCEGCQRSLVLQTQG